MGEGSFLWCRPQLFLLPSRTFYVHKNQNNTLEERETTQKQNKSPLKCNACIRSGMFFRAGLYFDCDLALLACQYIRERRLSKMSVQKILLQNCRPVKPEWKNTVAYPADIQYAYKFFVLTLWGLLKNTTKIL